MNKETWKGFERVVAKFFGTKRTPLSGSASRHTKSDTLHPELFIECKHRKKMAIWSLYEKTKKMAEEEGKIPVLTLKEKGKKGFLICVHQQDWEKIK